MNISLFIAFRYWRSKSGDRFGQLVSMLASVGIVLGVMALIIVLSVMNGLENRLKSNLLYGLPHAIVSPTNGQWQKQETLSVPSFVHKTTEINYANVIIQSQYGINAGQLIGVKESNDDPLLAVVPEVSKRLPEGKYNVIINHRLAQQLKLSLGDQIRLIVTENSQYTPFGRVPVQRLFTVSEFYASNQEENEYTLFANLTDVGQLLRINTDQVKGIRLFLDDPFQVNELTAYFPKNRWQVSDWREQKGEFFQAVKMEKNMMGLLISLIIIVAVSNIITSLSLMVVDKQGEIAILQTQGLTKRAVMRVFIAQGAIVGIIGTFVGAILGLIISHYLGELLNIFNPNGVFLPSKIDFYQVALIVVASMGLSFACTLYPAYRAAKIDPAEALRYE